MRLKTFALSALFSLVVIPSFGQDLLANQAPVDRKMKAVDTLMLQQLIQNEVWESSPAADLYDNWENGESVYVPTALPDTFKVDLRGYHMPTSHTQVTSNFGARWGRQHKGLDIKVYIGDPIYAAFDGKVRVVRNEPRGYGKYIVIRHTNGLETTYGHLSKQLVREGQDVRAGETIGLGGNTGRSTGSHLHFETRLCGVAINPALLFDFRAQDVTGDFYTYNRRKYASESALATRLRGANSATHNSRFDTDEDDDDEEMAIAAPEASFTSDVHFHKVKKGETLQTIAKKRGMTVDALCKLNHIGKNIRLMPGQILKYN